jgi:hypothetical protein
LISDKYITEQFVDEQILIYPNPGFGDFKMRFDFGRDYKIRYDVLNSAGKLISTSGFEKASKGMYSINLIAQSAGYYYVKFYVDDIVVTKKLLNTK